jgi:hypothetical protein
MFHTGNIPMGYYYDDPGPRRIPLGALGCPGGCPQGQGQIATSVGTGIGLGSVLLVALVGGLIYGAWKLVSSDTGKEIVKESSKAYLTRGMSLRR